MSVAVKNLLGCDRAALQGFFAELGEKPFRAGILLRWMHRRGETDFARMTDLSGALRERLRALAEVAPPQVHARRESADGTVKWAVGTSGGNTVETVLIPDGGRRTLCVSSQAGCALDCAFCATGKQGFAGNLTAAEVVGQVWLATRELAARGDGQGITNVVFMGMGEPLLNFDAAAMAASVLMDDLAYGLSKRRVTISTAGVAPRIRELAERVDCALAVSLHAPDDALRDALVPLNRRYPIAELLDACAEWLAKVGPRRSVTIEYALLRGVNDGLSHARALAKLLRPIRCKINLIPFNPFPGAAFARPTAATVAAFHAHLSNAGHTATVRTTRGEDIAAACGQLVGAVQDRTRRSARHAERLQATAAAAALGTGINVTQPAAPHGRRALEAVG